MLKYIAVFILLCMHQPLTAQTKWHLKGTASTLKGGCVQLTTASLSQAGAAWNPTKINIKKGFKMAFRVYLGTNQATGADGIAFILQKDSNGINAIGQAGGALGWCSSTGKGIHPSIGIELDTYDNAPSWDDSIWNHMAVILNGDLWTQPVGPVPALPSKKHIDDGKEHILMVSYSDTTHLLKAWFDCNLRMTYKIKIDSAIFHGDSMVYYGFTGATGGLDNVQQFCELKPTIANGKNVTICSGYSVKLKGTTDTGYFWTPSTALSCTRCSTTTASPTITTTYYYRSDISCLNIADSVVVTVNALAPGRHFNKDTTICLGTPVTLKINDAHSLKLDRSLTDSLIDSSTVWLYPLVTSTFTLTYHNYCRHTDTLYYTVYVNNPDSSIHSPAICKGQRYRLPKGKTVTVSGVYVDTLKGINSCDSIVVTKLLVKLHSYQGVMANICNGSTYILPKGEIVSSPGVYRDTFANAVGCDSVVTTTVHLLHTNLISDTAIICAGQQYALRKGEIVKTAGTFTDTFINRLGCDSIFFTTVRVISPPLTSYRRYVLCYYDSVLLESSVPFATYVWGSGQVSPGIYVSSGGFYKVDITLAPCPPVTDSFFIYMKQCDTLLDVPSAFTPNNDGLNDVFYPIHLGGIVIKEFKVYNRWGNILYDKPIRGWDGTFKGIPQPQGTYYYVIRAEYLSGSTYKPLSKKGDVQLLR